MSNTSSPFRFGGSNPRNEGIAAGTRNARSNAIPEELVQFSGSNENRQNSRSRDNHHINPNFGIGIRDQLQTIDKPVEYTNRSQYDKDRKARDHESRQNPNKADFQDYCDRGDTAKLEFTNKLENSIKCREIAIDALKTLNSLANLEKSPFKSKDSIRSSIDISRMSIDAVNQRQSDLLIFDSSRQIREETKDTSNSNNEMYKKNIAYLNELDDIVTNLIQKDNTVQTLK